MSYVKRVLKTAAKWLLALCLAVMLLALSISIAANSLWLYQYGAEKYGVKQKLANSGLVLTDADLEQIYARLIGYFNSDEEYLSLAVVKDGQTVDLFTPEETVHFKDVKGLIWLDYWILAGTLIYILSYVLLSLFLWKDRRQVAQGLVWGSSLTLALLLALVLLNTISGFDRIFYQFHLLFFSNLFWSAEGYMLLLFPQGFFIDAATFGTLIMVGGAAVIGGIGVYCRRKQALLQRPEA
ncbi:MAG: hypothetical protein A2144_05625 [Chloroflexi bacterium RBG_16_50_9]|nr:MAG: hypothetical protein A2144_05625 [Chloroflexi bacterium RBG_16_50_9]